MKDRFGNDLKVGDRVIYSANRIPMIGIIIYDNADDETMTITKDALDPTYMHDREKAEIIAQILNSPVNFIREPSAVIKMNDTDYVELKLKNSL